MNVQHVRMPKKIGVVKKKNTLQYVDKLVYVYMRKHADKYGKTHVSLERLAKECNVNRRTVASAITRLMNCGELTIISKDYKKGMSKEYKFNVESKNYIMFSFKCLEELQSLNEDGKPKYSTSEKCVIIGLHEIEKNQQTYGYVDFKLEDLADKINMTLPTLKRAIKSLEEKGVMIMERSSNKVIRKVDYTKIFQDILYTKKKVEEHDDILKKVTGIMLKMTGGEQISEEEKDILKSVMES